MCKSCDELPELTGTPVPEEPGVYTTLGVSTSVAPFLVPEDEGPLATKLNGYYSEVMAGLMKLFNGGGPALAKKYEISPSQGRGIFISCFVQMVGAVCGMQFRFRPDQQTEMLDEVNEVVKKHAARAALFLPENQRMNRLVQSALEVPVEAKPVSEGNNPLFD